MKKIQQIYLSVQKHTYAAIALQLLFAIGITAIPQSQASAVQLTSRKIQMGDSGPSNNSNITSGTGSGTFVPYTLSFSTTNTSTAIGGIVIDFCSNTPLVGDTCTAPTGFDVNRTAQSVSNQTGMGAGSFTVFTTDTGGVNRIILNRATAANLTATASIEIGAANNTGFTNPSTTGVFYARIYTYATQAAARAHVTNSPVSYIDYGGVALATSSVITITARVQENLIFCVFGGASPNANCAAAGGSTSPALTIGHVTTGTTKYIDSSAVDSSNAFTQLSTNAGSGATVRMHTSTTNGGLESGSNGIPPASAGSNAPNAITAGSAAFGLIVFPGSGGTGTITADSNYYDVAHDTGGETFWYGMDSTTSADNVTTSYGDRVFYSGAPVSNVNNTLTFAATASNVTPAGLYAANLALIATGTF